MRMHIFLLVLALGLVPVATAADAGEQDHDQARDLYERGDLRGLGNVLERAIRTTPGEVVRVDLMRENGAWIYRLEIVQADGHRKTVEIDAAADVDDDTTGGSGSQ